MIINRDPQGHFIGREIALSAWLPKLMRVWFGDPVVAVLEIAARYAGEELQRRVEWQNDVMFDLWTRRWRFLRKALQDWQAIK